ncbi:hypothetical protein OA78_1284 [Latilactobacillus curvatus]|nr:hypothetical protein OA78_1284 [Latilactobacillus curvatus]
MWVQSPQLDDCCVKKAATNLVAAFLRLVDQSLFTSSMAS